MHDLRETKRSGRVADTELTALTIACLKQDVKLVEKLIQKGADVDLVASVDRLRNYYYCGPIYCAAANYSYDVEIVKLLIDALRDKTKVLGVDITRFQGFRQCGRHGIIGPIPRHFQYSSCFFGPEMFLKVLEQYLNAGVKLNTTSWGPCLFLGRGKVNTKVSYPSGIYEPWFFCTAAIMLLQHGVDPNLYKIDNVLRQRCKLYDHIIYRFVRNMYSCIDKQTFITTFLAAGYDLTVSDMNCFGEDFRKSDIDLKIMNDFGRPQGLKHLARTIIREHIRSVNMDTSVFPVIDKLKLPTILKDFLKLYDVSPAM
ncbi:uncharacterized protein LOC127710450 [Mytilus californianus]|uniref:uncharacterized protein LOC127710450 n=1 Tax=Mytilus californianus TaxID=6549 RepID=UPI002248576D|nr:uncharacterized protein LOC127710450 [Mytilus californianus]